MAKALMIQGTGSHVGKSTLVAALCRVFYQDGYRVAPFKAQNMALNSFVTHDGYEMGRAQAVQAMAAGIEPRVDMNPVLLKPTSDLGAQVILLGRVLENMRAREYHSFKPKIWGSVKSAYTRLDHAYDLVVIEGAGSPVEVNLKKQDISNMRVAKMAKAPVILVGDIDRGGVFASLIGTLQLLSPSERALVAGFIINKFRGDQGLLGDGLKFLERKTGRPVLGVMPYIPDLFLEEEDGVALDQYSWPSRRSGPRLKIAVIHLPHISNFTDFDPLRREPDVELFYARRRKEIEGADLVILPGTKNTIEDLAYVKQIGIDEGIRDVYRKGGQVIGICGGFQMLGRTVSDPQGIESRRKKVQGLGLLAVETVLQSPKITTQVKARMSDVWTRWGSIREKGALLSGYEIHMGRTRRIGKTRCIFEVLIKGRQQARHEDGAMSPDGRVWGTYLHGLFENDFFRNWFLGCMRIRRGCSDSDMARNPTHYNMQRQWAFDHLAQTARKHLNLKKIYELL